MNQETLMAGHEIKLAFLREAIGERVHLIRPKNTSAPQWSKQRKIGFRYAFQDITLEELGREYGGTRQGIQGLNRHFLDNMHENSPPQLQAQYPREAIPDRKPPSQRLRERTSDAHGGISLRIKQTIEERGIAVVRAEDVDDIAKAAGVTKQQVLSSRHVLENWGIHIGRLDNPYASFAKKVKDEEDDQKLQELLDSSSVNSLRGFLQRDSGHKTLTTVSATAKERGFSVHTIRVRSVAQKIKKAGIPMRQILHLDQNGKVRGSYYAVYAKHEDRIAEVLRNDPDSIKI